MPIVSFVLHTFQILSFEYAYFILLHEPRVNQCFSIKQSILNIKINVDLCKVFLATLLKMTRIFMGIITTITYSNCDLVNANLDN